METHDIIQNVILETLKDRLEKDGLTKIDFADAENPTQAAKLSITEARTLIVLWPNTVTIEVKGGSLNHIFAIPDFKDPSFNPDFLYDSLAEVLQELKRLGQKRHEICEVARGNLDRSLNSGNTDYRRGQSLTSVFT